MLTTEQLRGIMESICGVVVDLGESADNASDGDLEPSSPDASSIVCIAGRGPLDEAVCAMLAQVLGKRGLRARVVSHESVSRAHIAALDLTGVRLLLVSYIEGANSLSPLRYLVRRLRQRSGDATIMVGMWVEQAGSEDAERVQSAVGADRYVSSLRDAVDASLEMERPAPVLSRQLA